MAVPGEQLSRHKELKIGLGHASEVCDCGSLLNKARLDMSYIGQQHSGEGGATQQLLWAGAAVMGRQTHTCSSSIRLK